MSDHMVTVPERLERWATEHPDRPFIVEVDGRTATFGQFHTETLQWAAAYRALGIGAGDHIATMVKPSATAYASWLGMSWLRAVDVACNTEFRGSVLAYILRQSRSRIAVVEADYLPQVAAVAGDLPDLERVVVLGSAPPRPDCPVPVHGSDALLADQVPATGLEAPKIWDTSMMIYTSGTTGPSKGVELAWLQVHYGTLGLFPPDDMDATDAFYSPFPMYHSSGRAGLCLMSLHGGQLVIRDHFSGSGFWDDIVRHGCTTTALVGAMTNFVSSRPPSPDDADNPLKRAVMFPLVPDFKEFEQRFGLKLTTCFAMTESGPVISAGWSASDPASCGVVRDGYEVRIVDEHDLEVPVGEVGELIVRHRDPWAMCQGYFDMPEKSVELWRNGWLHTGDAFRKDEEGRYYFVDRIKDAIRRRGVNISSFEVEALVNAHPGVVESAAIPVPSEWGEDEVKVCVVRSDATLTEERLLDELAPSMPRFMLPRYVEFTGSLPKTEATQRVKKAELRRDPMNDRTWDREAGAFLIAG